MEEKNPKHAGIILDGNRRYAKKLAMQPWKGHELGAKRVEELFSWAYDLGLNELTLYAFSIENFNRPKDEIDHLMQIFEEMFGKTIKKMELEKKDVRIRFIGRKHLFSKKISDMMTDLEERTKHAKTFIVNFALGYGGKSEIADAAKKIAKDAIAGKLNPEDIDEKKFAEYLYMPDEPDFIIRTGGQIRTSNFLPFQSTYSEWFFVEKFWPEFTKEDLAECIQEFKNRKRNFGK